MLYCTGVYKPEAAAEIAAELRASGEYARVWIRKVAPDPFFHEPGAKIYVARKGETCGLCGGSLANVSAHQFSRRHQAAREVIA